MKRVSITLFGMLLLTIMVAACGDSTVTPGSSATTSSSTVAGTVTGSATTTGATTSSTTIGTTTAGTTTSGTATTSNSGTTTSGTTTSMATTTPATTSMGTTTAGSATTTAGATTSASGLTQTDTGLPAYTGARVLSIGSAFESSLAMPLAQQIVGSSASNVRYQLFATTDTSDKVFTFYDGEMTKLGLSKYMAANTTPTTTPMASSPLASLSNMAKFAMYSKDNSNTSPRAGLAVIGPLDSTTLTALTMLDSSFGSNLKAGDNLVMLVNALPTSGS